MGVPSPAIQRVPPRFPPQRIVSRDEAMERWCEQEARREVDALMEGKGYTFRTPEAAGAQFEEGVGFVLPPHVL